MMIDVLIGRMRRLSILLDETVTAVNGLSLFIQVVGLDFCIFEVEGPVAKTPPPLRTLH